MVYLTVIAGLELLIVAGLVVVLVLRERDHAKHVQALLASTTAERHTLLTRIQRPEIVPPGPPAPAARVPEPTPPRDIGELAKIGMIAPQAGNAA